MRKLPNKDRNKTGIEYEPRDKTQSWRVWHRGKIIFFAHTLEEANRKLQEALVRRTRIDFKEG